MASVRSIHHIAVVVADMSASLAFWRDALGMQLGDLRDVAAEQSQVAFLPTMSTELELVLPTTQDSGIAKYLAKHGPGIHHVCLEVDDLAAMLVQLKAHGVRLINEEARPGLNGRQYAFVHPESTGGVLVELYQT
jgi:methylmalonyl-CoA/ethylmalonyl-CoA epimerase